MTAEFFYWGEGIADEQRLHVLDVVTGREHNLRLLKVFVVVSGCTILSDFSTLQVDR